LEINIYTGSHDQFIGQILYKVQLNVYL